MSDEPRRPVEVFIDGRAIARQVAQTRAEFAASLAARSISGYEYTPPDRRTACPTRLPRRLLSRLLSLIR